jgi:hypothetical protein
MKPHTQGPYTKTFTNTNTTTLRRNPSIPVSIDCSTGAGALLSNTQTFALSGLGIRLNNRVPEPSKPLCATHQPCLDTHVAGLTIGLPDTGTLGTRTTTVTKAMTLSGGMLAALQVMHIGAVSRRLLAQGSSP